MVTKRWKVTQVETARGFMVGFTWWGWKCWRYANHTYGITALGPITIYWGRA
jgi:hypothetical protein